MHFNHDKELLMQRTLVAIPIFHNPWKENSLGMRLAGCREADGTEYLAALTSYWNQIDAFLAPQTFDRVYCDSMIAGGDTGKNLVKKYSQQGLRQWQTMERLIEGGAKLEKTESAMKCIFQSAAMLVPYASALQKYAHDLRDSSVVNYINKTLLPAETGILFHGKAHNVDSALTKCKVRVERFESPHVTVLDSLIKELYDKCARKT